MITFEGPQCMWTNPFKKSRQGSDPPSWQCLYFGNFWSGNPSLTAASIVNASGMFEVIQDAVEALECYCGTLNATICRGPSRQHWWQLHFFYVPCSLWLTKFEIFRICSANNLTSMKVTQNPDVLSFFHPQSMSHALILSWLQLVICIHTIPMTHTNTFTKSSEHGLGDF